MSNKVVSFKACTGIGMFDPVCVDIVLEDGSTKELTYPGRAPLTPKQFLEKDGYIVDSECQDEWEWPKHE